MSDDLLILRSTAVARGLNADDIRRRIARGDWRVVRRGIYSRTSSVAYLGPTDSHRLLVRATLLQLSGGHVASHLSAACLHGLDLLRQPGDVVHVTNPATHSGHRRRTLRTFCAALDPDEITTVDGVSVTTVARTIIDVARLAGFDQGVVAANHALRRGLVDRDQLRDAALRATRRSGVRTAHQVVAFADPGAESAGESRSRIVIDRAGLPRPELQFRIRNHQGTVIARTDFWWPEYRTVGEFDGKAKYRRDLRPGRTPADAVHAEKVREDRIRDLGLHVVRWTWDELDDPAALGDKIRHALDRGRARPG